MNTQKNVHQCDPVDKTLEHGNEGIVIEVEEHCKRFATLAAKAAIAGHALTQTSTGYMLSRWQYSRHCTDLDAVGNLLRRMGALA